MVLLFRWLIRAFLALSLVTALTIWLGYYFVTRSLPDYDADFTLDGLAGPVEIVRDNYLVPHIFPQHDIDSYYALGFVHAQDRLWQMTMSRRTAQGRLSELFGTPTADIDEFLRRLDIYGIAQRAVAYQDAQTMAVLEAYSAGINAWIAEVAKGALGRGAPEFFLFSPEIAPWTPADSLAVAKLMNLQISSALQTEIQRAKAALVVGDTRMRDIMPDAVGQSGLALEQFATLFPKGAQAPMRAAAWESPFNPMRSRALSGASNAFAAAPQKTARRGSLLANDPHLGLSAPSIWMLARMDFEDESVIGGSIPGLPGIIVGRNTHFGWGLTTTGLDDVDLYVEKLNPDNPTEVLTPEGYKPMRSKRTIIQIKDAQSRTIDLQWTENGPVLPKKLYDLDTITPKDHVMSVSWTALREDDQSTKAYINLIRAKSVQEARRAMRDYHAPAQNLIMVDNQSIGFQVIGRMPQRDPAHVSKGRLPSQGWLERNRWQEDFDYIENPSSINPASGIVLNSNNKVTERAFPRHVSFNWGDDQRINRLVKLIGEREIHTRDSFQQIQLDRVSPTARTLLPLVGKELWFTTAAAPPGSPEERRQRALELLANWNGEMDPHVPEPLIYYEWMRQLQHLIILDEMGPLAEEFRPLEPAFIERVYRDVDGASVWCDIRTSSVVETCDDIAIKALDQAIYNLSGLYGDRLNSWRWGQAHQARHDHQVLGKIPLLNWLVNIRQDTGGGDNTLLRGKTAAKGDAPFANIHAAGFRSLIDMADPEASLYVISTGQSGHFLSRHYDDLAQLWRRGEYIPMTLDPELARSGAEGVTTLNPSGN